MLSVVGGIRDISLGQPPVRWCSSLRVKERLIRDYS